MSLRSVFSRLLSSRGRRQLAISHSTGHDLDDKTADKKQPKPTWRQRLVFFLIAVTLLLSAVWLLLAIWYQYGAHSVLAWLASIAIVSMLAALLGTRYWDAITARLDSNASSNKKTIETRSITKETVTKGLLGLYAVAWALGVSWFFSIEPKQDRNWMAEVDRQVAYERDPANPDLVTLTNVRNFDWHTDTEATEHWERRTVDLSKLSGIDVTNSYWMGPLIAHTLVSFRFEDDRPLAFSFESVVIDGWQITIIDVEGRFIQNLEITKINVDQQVLIGSH